MRGKIDKNIDWMDIYILTQAYTRTRLRAHSKRNTTAILLIPSFAVATEGSISESTTWSKASQRKHTHVYLIYKIVPMPKPHVAHERRATKFGLTQHTAGKKLPINGRTIAGVLCGVVCTLAPCVFQQHIRHKLEFECMNRRKNAMEIRELYSHSFVLFSAIQQKVHKLTASSFHNMFRMFGHGRWPRMRSASR